MRFLNMQAVRKFKQGIDIDGSRHDTKWCLGNAYTSQVGGVGTCLNHASATHGTSVSASLFHWAGIHTNQQYAIAQGFLTADSNKAQQFFDLATEQFDTALKQVCPLFAGRGEGSSQPLT